MPSSPGGRPIPVPCSTAPIAEATMSGFVAIERAMPARLARPCAKRAKTRMQKRFAIGTMVALATAASAMPGPPRRPAATVSPT